MEEKQVPRDEWITRSGVILDYSQPTLEQETTMQIGHLQPGGPKDGGVENRGEMYPVLHAEVPKGKFMQAMNFDKLLGLENVKDTDDNSIEEGNIDNGLESSMDLIEQQQAMEQTRLLERFKELRQWQFKQQEVLMMQQQQQLEMLRKEQQRVQSTITKQRQSQWGGGAQHEILSPTHTPPRRRQPGKSGRSPGNMPESHMSRGQLPMPIMYVPLTDETGEEDEIKTNPDLFSDVGSNIAMDDCIDQLPDVQFGDGRPEFQNKKPPNLAQIQHQVNQMRNSRVKQEMLDRSPIPQPNFSEVGSESGTRSSLDNEIKGQQFVEDGDSDDIEQLDTAGSLENRLLRNSPQTKSKSPDDRPIKPGVGGRKTFEELIEEQMRFEKEKREQNNSPSVQKREFLRKGHGTSRYKVKANIVVSRRNNSNTVTQSKKNASSKQAQKVSPKSSVKSSLKSGNTNSQALKRSSNIQNSLTNGMSVQNHGNEKTAVTRRGSMESDNRKLGTNMQSDIPEIDSIPDDASFVEKLKKREANVETEKAELEEFEMLEDYADNMSFRSNSSLVVHFLKKGRANAQNLPRIDDEQKGENENLRMTDQKRSVIQEITDKTGLPACEEENAEDDTLADVSTETESSESESESESDSESESELSNCDQFEMFEKKVQFDDRTSGELVSKIDEKELYNSKSPKIMTRKIAVKDSDSIGGDAIALLPKVAPNTESQLRTDTAMNVLDTNLFTSTTKSPVLLSREVLQQQYIHDKQSKNSDLNDKADCGESMKLSLSNGERVTDQDNYSTGQQANCDDSTDADEFDFDDEDEWQDTNTTLKASDADSTNKEKRTLTQAGANLKPNEDGTPPTSRLVSRLFPQLHTNQAKKEQQNQQKVQTLSQTAVSDGIQSRILREKLVELEKEIERFRNENLNLEKLRQEREEGLSKLKKEILDFEKEKQAELQRIQEYKAEEMKKLWHEKKVFEKYQKAARAQPDKKEREEIELLKNQFTELQEEIKRKESRWTSSNSRLRNKLEQVEQENLELRDEIKLMEKKRLEWLQKEQAVKNTQPKNSLRSSTPTIDFNESISSLSELNEHRMNTDAVIGLSPVAAVQSKSQPSLRPTQSHHAIRPIQSAHQIASKMDGHSKRKPQAVKGPNVKNAKSSRSGMSAGSGSQISNSSGPPTNSKSLKHGSRADRGNILRMSLTEDIPRQLATTAVPQDVSIYSDSGNDVQAPDMLPQKLVSRVPVVGSAIDKGDEGFEEIQHSDGKIERIYRNGAREILFSNGTRKEISSDGQSIVVSFFNGDMKQIMADQRVIYYYADAQTTHINHPDGLEILQFPNNQTEKHYPDGTNEITFPDHTIKYLFPNGSEESIFPDGTIIRIDKAGDKTMEFPNGQREIHTQEFKRREYPDGTVKTVYPDGRQETKYSNGRLRIKDKDGNIVIDHHC